MLLAATPRVVPSNASTSLKAPRPCRALTGQQPFRGENLLSLADAIRSSQPPSLTGNSSSLSGVVSGALHKSQSQRYQAVAELLGDLGNAADSATRPTGQSDVPSIAVLPFANMSADPEQEYFCDGLAEELIDTFARLEGLKVVARTSTFKFKGQADDIRRIGEQLDVSTVLEGSVRKAGNRLRITAQLINVSDGYHLWSERYDRTLDDVFAVQEEIAQAIVGMLKVKLVGEPEAALVKVSTTNLDAYNLVLQGRHHVERFNIALALDRYDRALSIEPDYALAHALVSRAQLVKSILGLVTPRDAVPRARAAAERALSLDPDCGEAALAMANIRSYYEWDWDGAEHDYRRAIELGPSSSQVHADYAEFLWARGRPDEAIVAARRAADLDPLSPNCLRRIGMALMGARRFDEAIEQFRTMLELDRHFYVGSISHAIALLVSNRSEEGVTVLENARQDAAGNPLTESFLGVSYVRVGRRDEAKAIAEALTKRRGEGYVSAYCIGLVHLELGEDDAAMTWFEQAYRDRDGMCPYMETLNKLGVYGHAAEREPRLLDLLRRIEEGGKE